MAGLILAERGATTLTKSGVDFYFPWGVSRKVARLADLNRRQRQYLRWLSERFRKPNFHQGGLLVQALAGNCPYPRAASRRSSSAECRASEYLTFTAGEPARYSSRLIPTSSSAKSQAETLHLKRNRRNNQWHTTGVI